MCSLVSLSAPMQGQDPMHNLIRRLQTLCPLALPGPGPASHESVADQEALEALGYFMQVEPLYPLHAVARCLMLTT
jgi:hypothetical protein